MKLMIYGAYDTLERQLLQECLSQGLKPILAGDNGQKTMELARELDLDCCIFSLKTHEIKDFIEGVEVIFLCAPTLEPETLALGQLCALRGIHLFHFSKQRTCYEQLNLLHQEFLLTRSLCLAGLHPEVLASELLAALLKSRMPDATELSLASAQAPGIWEIFADNFLEFGRTLASGHLRETDSLGSLEVPFYEDSTRKTLVLHAPHAGLFAAWEISKVAFIDIFRTSSAFDFKILKLAESLRWIINLPWLKTWLRRWILRGSYQQTMKGSAISEDFRFYGSAQDASGKKISLILLINKEWLTEKMTWVLWDRIKNPSTEPGFNSGVKMLGLDYFTQQPACRIHEL